jgi:anti-anti-sigma factor
MSAGGEAVSSLIDRPQGSRVHRLRLAGELDVATGPDQFLRIIEAGPEAGDSVELDFSDVTFIDSSGVAMLMKAQSYLAGGGCRLVLTNLSSSAHRLLDMLGLNETFDLEPASQSPPEH